LAASAALKGGKRGLSGFHRLSGQTLLDELLRRAGTRMTAEIAILNKDAVALAADSAVTISAGQREEKTFDSADKLFELCRHNPIGVMVYNGLSFAETPLQLLFKRFRGECGCFASVKDAANSFLEYLNAFGRNAPKRVREDSIKSIVVPVLQRLAQRFQQELQQRILNLRPPSPTDPPFDFNQMVVSILEKMISAHERIYQQAPDAEFVGGGVPEITPEIEAILSGLIPTQLQGVSDDHKQRLLAIAKLILRKNIVSNGATGIVIAGFGTDELFPTLVSFELDGMIGGRLKYVRRNFIDIDRDGERARVIPFAQKEMVDRFLYGLDDSIERQVTAFCKNTIPDIRAAILNHLEFEAADERGHFEQSMTTAEEAFIEGLKSKAFDVIRAKSQSSIDQMVEFMPKPELAKMAEALVNLTSIKKRVTRGMDTVGGPIDVAVISQSEGFVWVKRKHYFPPDLNQRYLARVGNKVRQDEELLHDENPKPRRRHRARDRKGIAREAVK
jgi:hypothetical protein